jgi:hypothetical protein
MPHVADSVEATRSNRRVIVAGLVAVLAIFAAWWVAGTRGELSGARMHGRFILVPTDDGRNLLLAGWAASLAVALCALALLGRDLSVGLRRWAWVAAILLVATTVLNEAVSVPPEDELLGSCDISPAGEAAYRFRTYFGEWNPDGFHAIVVRTGATYFETTYRIEAAQKEDDGRVSGAPVLAPAHHGDVVVNQAGIVALYVHRGCAAIWDSRSRRTLWNGRDVRGPVGLLVLLEPVEAPDADTVGDFVRFTESVRTDREQGMKDRPAYIAESELMAALRDTRPSIRAAACAIAEAGGKVLYPSAALLAVLERRR